MTSLESNGANRDQKLNFGRVIRGTNMESNPKNLDDYFENIRQACEKAHEAIENLMYKLTILEEQTKK